MAWFISLESLKPTPRYIGHVLDYTRKEADPIINTKIYIAIHNYRRYTFEYTRIGYVSQHLSE
jgi:hypothetical protein